MNRWRNILFVVLLLFLFCGAGISAEAKTKAKVKASKQYMIRINKQQNVVNVYKHVKGKKYKPYRAFVCSTGPGTPVGTFHLLEKMRWHQLDGPTYGQYCSRITGRILFHSVWYYKPDKTTQSYIQYNRLGTAASHGCVRLTVWDAKWIFDNCPSGTKIIIYNSSDPGPFGKPKALKVSGFSGWDPTDPDPANPYWKKQPEITGVKKKTIRYGAKVKIQKGIRAKDSFGKNASSKVKVSIWFKALAKDKYKKVKKINTKVPGNYKVVYRVTDILKHTARKAAVFRVVPAKKITSLKLNHEAMTLYVGGTASEAKGQLKVSKVLPKKASYKRVRYSSSNKKIVTVTARGAVRAKKKGSAVIRVSALDGSGKKAACRVIVKRISEKPPKDGPVKDPVAVSGSAVKIIL